MLDMDLENTRSVRTPPPPSAEISTSDGPSEARTIHLWGTLLTRRDATVLSAQESSWQQRSLLIFGQAIALGAASMNAASYTLEYNLGVIVPIFLMCITYLILSTHLLYMRKEQRIKQDDRAFKLPFSDLRLHVPWWTYLGMAVVDVVSNYFMLVSLNFTTLTNTTLLGSLTVPATMVASRYILARTFRLPHFIGVCLCLLGGTLTVWMDVGKAASTEDTEPSHPHSYIGDMLAIAAAMLYGLGDTIGEYSIKHIDRVEYLGMLGLFGAILTCLSLPLLEGRAVYALFVDTPTSALCAIFAVMIWYLASLIFYYVASTIFYIRGDATLLNLSLQTSNMWAILFTVIAEQEPPSTSFYLSAVLVVTGVFVYEMGPKTVCGRHRPGSSQEKEPFNMGQLS
jgi:solute carrier family 35, member F1/2